MKHEEAAIIIRDIHASLEKKEPVEAPTSKTKTEKATPRKKTIFESYWSVAIGMALMVLCAIVACYFNWSVPMHVVFSVSVWFFEIFGIVLGRKKDIWLSAIWGIALLVSVILCSAWFAMPTKIIIVSGGKICHIISV